MKKYNLCIALLFMAVLTMSSCELIGDIFEAGVWAGILLVGVVLALVIFVVSKLFGGGK